MSHGTKSPAAPSPESLALNYEVSDSKARPLFLSMLALAVFTVFVFGFAYGLLALAGNGLQDQSNVLADTVTSQQQIPPAPRIEQNPQVDGTRIEAEARAQIAAWGWVNQRAGTAHIPIERAMELIVERGLTLGGN
jgi:hypothetical protein